MSLSDKSVQKFKEVFKKEYGKEYTDAEAREAAENLVGFFDLLIKVDRRNKEENLKNNKPKKTYKGNPVMIDEKGPIY